MRVADQLYWLAHTDVGTPRIGPATLGLALGGGLLGELLLNGKIQVWGSGCLACCDDEPPDDAAGRFLYFQIARDPHQQVATWVNALEPHALGQVVARLYAQRLLASAAAHRFPRVRRWSGPRYSTAGRRVQALPWALLSRRLARQDPLNTPSAFVVSMAVVTGLRSHLLDHCGPDATAYADTVPDELPEDLRQIVTAVETAVGQDVLTHRG